MTEAEVLNQAVGAVFGFFFGGLILGLVVAVVHLALSLTFDRDQS